MKNASNRKNLRALLGILLIFSMLLPIATAESASVTLPVKEDKEFGVVIVDATQDEFGVLGAVFGDSLDVKFSSGFVLEDIPYFDGYYCRVNQPAVVNYPDQGLYIAYCSGDSMWERSGSKEGDTVTFTVREKGKYLAQQNTMASVYVDDRSAFSGDEVFANFRAAAGGNLRTGTFFRGASPVDNVHLRASTVDSLLEENGIKFILDLADDKDKITSYMESSDFSSDYSASLYKKGNMALLGLSASYRSDKFKTTLVQGIKAMMGHEGPYYIHCTEGKDRTGFVCLLMEALAGASYEEIEADYMKTYDNYYGITEESQPEKYTALKELRLHDMLLWLAGLPDGTDLTGMTFEEGAENYLLSGGMSATEVDWFRTFLTTDVIIVTDPDESELITVDDSVQQEVYTVGGSLQSSSGSTSAVVPDGEIFYVEIPDSTSVPVSSRSSQTGTGSTSAAIPDGEIFYVEIPDSTPVPASSRSSQTGTGSTSTSTSIPEGEIFYVDIPDSTPVPVSTPSSQSGGSSSYEVPGYQPSYGTSGLSLYVSSGSEPADSYTVNVTVTVYLSHSQLSSVSMPLTITLDGQTANLTASSVSGSGSTVLGSYTFNVYLPEGESRSLPVSAAWSFNGTYSGQSISTLNCSDTVYVSR